MNFKYLTSDGYSITLAAILMVNLLLHDSQLQASEPLDVMQLDNVSWRLVTDGVMGGVSEGSTSIVDADDIACVALTGQVRTENNGGFIQIATDIDENTARSADSYQGIVLKIKANGENYNLHLRTSDLWFPWQAYRATFKTSGEWQVIKIPFDLFTAYKTGEALNIQNLKRIGVVAIGREFSADICVASVGFYREAAIK